MRTRVEQVAASWKELTVCASCSGVRGGGRTGVRGVRLGKVMRGRCWASVTTLLLTNEFILFEPGGDARSSLVWQRFRHGDEGKVRFIDYRAHEAFFNSDLNDFRCEFFSQICIGNPKTRLNCSYSHTIHNRSIGSGSELHLLAVSSTW